MRFLFGILISMCFGTGLAAQGPQRNVKDNPAPSSASPNESTRQSTESKINSLISLGIQNKPKQFDTSSANLASSLAYFNQAISLSAKNRLHSLHYKASIEKLEMLLFAGKIGLMEQMLRDNPTDSLKTEITRDISRYYNDGTFITKDFIKARDYGLQSLQVAKAINDPGRQINAHNQLGFVYIREKRNDDAEAHFLQVISIGKGSGLKNIGYAYFHLIKLYERRGYLHRAMQFGFDALRYLDQRGYDFYGPSIYQMLGRVYNSLGEREKSIEYFNLSRKESIRNSYMETYWLATRDMVDVFLEMDQAERALNTVQEAIDKHPSSTVDAQIALATMRGRIYFALGEYDLSQNYLNQALRINVDSMSRYILYKNLAEVYFATGDYNLSRAYLDRILRSAHTWTVANYADVYLLGFRVDSARGLFPDAIIQYQKSKQINDSLRAIAKHRQIEELQLQYQTEKITQDNRLKQQTILLLENQRQLELNAYEESKLKFLIDDKENENRLLRLNAEATEKDRSLLISKQNITQLQTDNANRQASLEKAKFTRNITIGFLFLIVLVAILLYRQYRTKQASTKIIGMKNAALEEVLKEKENLLEEKDWLLKEVHHRVKNNLHTVVSLLESQSVYLDNKALEANLDSRNRVYAMSLVHQKLYQPENVATIQMDTYLTELVEYLRESMGARDIYFKLELIPVKLDVSQAISLGLIINESITNSIKHAFPGTSTGRTIEITMTENTDHRLCLVIRDNGIGLSSTISNEKPRSLGLKLMKGLTGDVMGNFDIRSDNGTIITISFLPDNSHGKIDAPVQART